MPVTAMAAEQPGGPLKPIQYDPGALQHDEVEIDVSHCGICHSDLSMYNNDWQMTQYPFVPGHEVAGTVAAVGDRVTHLAVGQTVGLGWWARSCMMCDECMGGQHNRCLTATGTILGRHGGFANKVRAQASWVFPLPEQLDPALTGPLLCGGITVFTPLLQHRLNATHHVGVVGIGGLGHMALGFARAFGCEVTAFSTSPDKEEEARRLGAHHFVATRDPDALKGLANTFDMVLVTVNVPLDWDAYIAALKPGGVLHQVGAAPRIEATVFPLMLGQKSISGSPVGNIVATRKMLELAGRHAVQPLCERFPMSKANEALEHLEHGRPRYRIVLEQDLP